MQPISFQDVTKKGDFTCELDDNGNCIQDLLQETSDNAGTKLLKDLDDQFPTQNTDLCPPRIASTVGSQIDTKNIKVVVHVKGKNLESQALLSNSCPGGASGQCYVVPQPGTGTAGDRCNQYQPAFIDDSSGFKKVKNSVIGGVAAATDPNEESYVDQVDFACNWNKLTFGSTATDRVSIPLFFEEPPLSETADPIIVNPYKEGLADSFVLRVRTPCLPCADEIDENGNPEEGTRVCEEGVNKTVCSPTERYQLSDLDDVGSSSVGSFNNDIILQWKIQGKCEGPDFGGEGELSDCAVVALEVDNPDNTSEVFDPSAIYESWVNLTSTATGNEVLSQNKKAVSADSSQSQKTILQVLESYDLPVFSLLLNHELIAKPYGGNIPYLEYQLITDYPIASPSKDVTVIINVDGNIVTRSLEIKEDSEIIDFAIQSN